MPQKKRTASGVLGGLAGLVGLSVVAGVLVTATVTPALAVAGSAASQAIDLFDGLPQYLQIDRPMEPSNLYYTDADGNPVKLATWFDQNRKPVTYEQISTHVFDALLSSEDKHFYEHGGVDLMGTASAVVDNLRGTSSRGGSTISQQYVKNVLVQRCEQGVSPGQEDYWEALNECWLEATNASGSDGIQRKLQEMRYAIQIEKDYSKEEILVGYLNITNFGGQTYGIEAAANYYFGTTAANLTLDQAATLAGMVQNPNRLRIDLPGGTATNAAGEAVNGAEDGYSETLVRRNYVLKRMLEDGKITQEAHDAAVALPITPNIVAPTTGCAGAGPNAYFCQYVKSVIENDKAFGATKDERLETLRRGGLEIYTTLNPAVQEPAIAAMQEWVPTTHEWFPSLGAAGVTIEADTGRIVALTQNTVFTEEAALAGSPGYTSLVFAADSDHGSSIGFSVGSTYKLFTLIDWLEKGHSVNEIVNGRKRVFTKQTACGGPLPVLSAPIENFGDSGGYTGTVMAFTRDSLNSGYLAMAEQLDICDINKAAERMGVHLGTMDSVTAENNEYDVLGPKNIAPLQMAAAYATVANNGIYCTPRAIDRIIGQDGTELPLPESSCTQVISPEVAATAAYALEGVMNDGTGRIANPFDGTPLLGKTGTHEGYSTMMIESSTKAATAVWVGNYNGTDGNVFREWTDRGTRLDQLRYELAWNMQRAANAFYGGNAFPPPDNNLIRQVLRDLPNVVGMSIDDATKTLEDAGFSVNVGAPVDSEAAEGTIAAQDPGAGRVAGGTTVTISPSNGQGITVPNVSGNPAAAITQLQVHGFTDVSLGTCTEDEDAPTPGRVTGTTPAAGTAVNRSTPVRVDYVMEECP